MYLKRIELIGFKSFANKTTLVFDVPGSDGAGRRTGITAVVGPNGSGKSNVADAIRWVMGEQSMKSLRGKKSHDVIFAGSKGKTRQNFAQVTLYFDNSDKRIPISYEEISVSRKLYRDGEGEYKINGAKVRMLDVVDLLAAGGIGKESHCVLNQGMSDAILNANPFERRSIVEEAAGVKPFQIKRERALRKLAVSREHMDRTRGLLSEIEPRLRLLQRQAKRAEQRESVEKELKVLQGAYYATLWNTLASERSQAEEVKMIFGREVMRLQREIDELYEKKERVAVRLSAGSDDDALRRELSVLREKLSRAERENAMSEGRLEIERERKKMRRTVESIPVDLAFVRREITRIQTRQREAEALLQSAQTPEDIERVREAIANLGRDLTRLHEDCGKTRVEVKRDQAVLDAEEKRFAERIGQLEEGISVRNKEIESLRHTIREKEEKAIAQSQDAKKVNAEFLEMERELHAIQMNAEKAKDRWNESKISCARIEVREEELTRDIRETLGAAPQDLSDAQDSCDISEAHRKIAKLQTTLSHIGGIDPMVAEEYKETQERYDFLSGELRDLEETIVSLQKVVKEMDERIEKEFGKAFDSISREFSKFFTLMFDGGEARLERVKLDTEPADSREEEENGEENPDTEENISLPATSASRQIGIDIKVAPPKKRIHSLSMMSGGERSLVSLALLFAVISYSPPPFSVLDEVEAALDESNSERFSRILTTLARHTQFIVITHNRETMRAADILYGVTMGGDGVSQLLSVKLEGEEGK